MCRTQILETINADLPTVLSHKWHSTHKSLKYLQSRLKNAAVFDCGSSSEILARYTDRARLFIQANSYQPAKVLTLPNPNTLIVYTNESNLKIAAFLTDFSQNGLEIYIFYFDQKNDRWVWPLIGMRYGPNDDQIKKIAVYEPDILSGLSLQEQNNIVQRHSREMPAIMQALRYILETKPTPLMGVYEVERKISTLIPANTRTKHLRRGAVKGSHRG